MNLLATTRHCCALWYELLAKCIDFASGFRRRCFFPPHLGCLLLPLLKVYFFHDGVKFHVAAASNVLEKLRRFTAALSASAVGRGAVTIAGSSILIVHSRTMSSSCEHMEFCHRERGSRACRPRASVGTDMAWIDFGHVKFDSQTSSSIVSGSHNGMLHGLQSLSELLQIVVDTGGELSQKWDWERDEQRVSK